MAAGTPPPADGSVTVVAPPDSASVGVFAFTAHHVVAADVDPSWVSSVLPPGDLGAPMKSSFLSALGARMDRVAESLDVVLVGIGTGVPTGGLTPFTGSHSRAMVHHRVGVRMWTVEGGFLLLGRGVAGRHEVAVEVGTPGHGLGRGLFAAALGEVPVGTSVWAQVAPGNAASLRALLAAGYRPVGAEVLLV
ncbi:hypothetical protein EV186_108339 [Labedaea rhizosphaerae]|uniref:Acetyltransferase (GNAT) family protein n=1 Tax=Labedaea rhizosphaerae TaxID=598644 RepID=A0A4R6S0J9_LABRH|nr:hypothetical protein EV186_108339 [Labedaea rhizosphaerae]